MAGAEALVAKLPAILGKDVRVVRAPCMGACDRAPVVAVGHMQTFKATTDNVAAAVKAKPHAHAWKPTTDFAAYQKAGGYSLLKDVLAGKRTQRRTDQDRQRRRPARPWRRRLPDRP